MRIGFGYRNRGAQTRTTAADNHDVVLGGHRAGSRFVIAAVLVLQHLAVVSNRAYPHGSVVVEMPDFAAAAGKLEVVVGKAFVVALDVVIAVNHVPAGRFLLREVRSGRDHSPASSGAGT
ncbi:hypothetical protein [Mycobacterium tuberculosis]|uniref:hypothetical protein n=1 Tax=Mycobacterium tuberculosis TaxID=1773 RepID=UPI0018790989|nr:hypothetical protein [Mycobacterium tuberculosis]